MEKYIIRQLKLRSLGLEIDQDIENMISKFNSMVENIKITDKESFGFERKGHIYSNENNTLFFYNENMLLVEKKLWSIFSYKHILKFNSIKKLVIYLIKDKFDIEAKRAYLV